ncbi:AAA family ATPase [Streptomyces sp. NPDC002773]|uniref:ATP-dependent nuclease n=1 Tax=Streptomyces sp. NPDC002773 TaxID=3154430 RepID=UPI003318D255
MEPYETSGNPEELSVSISSVHLQNGTSITLPRAGVTVIVGPNNAGKSTLIREILAHVKHGVRREYLVGSENVVKEVDVEISGTFEDAFAWFSRHAKLTKVPNGDYFSRPQGRVSVLALKRLFSSTRPESGLDDAAEMFTFFGDAWQRLGGINSVDKRDAYDAPAENPLHVLQDRPDLFSELNEICRQIFGVTLTLDSLGRSLHLRVGETDLESPKFDEVTEEYWKAVSQLPMLSAQGDGMKSLVGLITPLVTSAYPVIFVDEPEAFLHPPQALALGQVLGSQARSKRTQVILATHDRNILSGLLQSGVEVSIVRLDRLPDGRNRTHQLEVESIREVWGDPVLRYSNALEGIFHKAVVLAEAERDCKFYASALEKLDGAEPSFILPGDILCVPSGGKDGFPRLAKVMKSLNVPVAVSPDLDILNDRNKLKTLVHSVGGDWSALEGLYQRATAEFRNPREATTINHVLEALNSVYAARLGEPFNSSVRAEFGVHMRAKESPWQELKRYGVAAFRADRVSANLLLEELHAIGIVPVHVGELEGFAPGIGVAKGPAWLAAALQAKAHEQEPARQHAAALLAAVSSMAQY